MDAMGFPARLLGADEYVVAHLRTHGKALILPACGLILAGGLTGAGAALVPSGYRPGAQYVVAGFGGLLAIWWALMPFLRWRTTTYTITNHRLISRRGVLSRAGKELPLVHVVHVSYDRSLSDRMLGCGTLYIRTVGDGVPVVLPDVPDVEEVHREMTSLLFGSAEHTPRLGSDLDGHAGYNQSAAGR